MNAPVLSMAPRVHRLADRLFLASINQRGIPRDDAETRGLATDCYHAALTLIAEGQLIDAALGAKRGAA